MLQAMKARKIFLFIGVAIIILIAILAILMYPSFRFFLHKEITQVDKNLTVITGGGNSGILVTDSAVVVIDTKMGRGARKLYDMAKEKAGQKKIIVINTHYHGDHTNGNKYFKGSRIYIGGYDKSFLEAGLKPENMPTDFVKDSLVLDLGDEKVLLCNLGRAHTFDDMIVYLENRKILFSGDLIFDKMNPVLVKQSGANIDQWIIALDRILEKWDIVTIIPGHGKVGGKELVTSLKQYFEDMKTAASNPSLEKELKGKYKDWVKMPGFASPGKTIEFIRNNR